jgi:hypothetical protein
LEGWRTTIVLRPLWCFAWWPVGASGQRWLLDLRQLRDVRGAVTSGFRAVSRYRLRYRMIRLTQCRDSSQRATVSGAGFDMVAQQGRAVRLLNDRSDYMMFVWTLRLGKQAFGEGERCERILQPLIAEESFSQCVLDIPSKRTLDPFERPQNRVMEIHGVMLPKRPSV